MTRKEILQKAREIEGLANELIDRIDEIQNYSVIDGVPSIPFEVDISLDELRLNLDNDSIALSEAIDQEEQ